MLSISLALTASAVALVNPGDTETQIISVPAGKNFICRGIRLEPATVYAAMQIMWAVEVILDQYGEKLFDGYAAPYLLGRPIDFGLFGMAPLVLRAQDTITCNFLALEAPGTMTPTVALFGEQEI